MNRLSMRSRKNVKVTLKQIENVSTTPLSMGHSESSPKKKIHSITGQPEEIRKKLRQCNVTLVETRR